MTPSTHLITDASTLGAGEFIPASNVTNDATNEVTLGAMAKDALANLTAAKATLTKMAANTSAGDPQMTLINNLLGALI